MPRFISVLVHLALLLLLVLAPATHILHPDKKHDVPYRLLPFHPVHARRTAHTSGGNESDLPVSKGRPPKPTPHPLFAPQIIRETRAPLVVDAEILAPEDVHLAQVDLQQLGARYGVNGPPSLGPGKKGIGGPGTGGLGDDPDGGPGVKSENQTGETIGPEVIYRTDPEFSEAARKAKLQGTVVLEALIGADGRLHNVHVRNGLGLGLDEKALEAVTRWRFRPALRNGKRINAPAVIEINFRLL